MSKTPQLDLQFDREPVLDADAEFVLQSFGPGVAPAFGVPAAASCHSRFVSSRFPDSRHACAAWNQSIQALGCTPAMETAYTPGDGGFDPKTGVHCPPGGKFAGKFVGKLKLHDMDSLNCVAPPLVRSASVAFPACTFFTSAVFAGSICHTLASYLSTQTFPTFIESDGHLSVPASAVAALVRENARARRPRIIFMGTFPRGRRVPQPRGQGQA